MKTSQEKNYRDIQAKLIKIGVNSSKLAEKTGISKGLFYHYFSHSPRNATPTEKYRKKLIRQLIKLQSSINSIIKALE